MRWLRRWHENKEVQLFHYTLVRIYLKQLIDDNRVIISLLKGGVKDGKNTNKRNRPQGKRACDC